MADDSEQPTQILSGSPTPPGSTATLEPHPPRLSDGGIGGPPPGRPPVGYGGGGGGDDGEGDDEGNGNDRRIAILAAVIGILVVIVLFLLLRPSDDDKTTPTSTPTPVATATPEPTPTPEPTKEPQPTPTPAPTPTPGPSGGASVDGGTTDAPVLEGGSITKFTASQGDTVVFRVRNTGDATQEVHVHGYDKSFPVDAGQTRTISFPATITGIFEIEFEATAEQIGELTVNP